MCDYSLHNVASRPAKVGDKLITASFASTPTRGFAAVGEPSVAVCVLPGTELAFENDVRWDRFFVPFFQKRKSAGKLVRFCQVNAGFPHSHHDAVEFPNGKIVLLTTLYEGQRATVLQLPAASQAADRAGQALTDAEVKLGGCDGARTHADSCAIDAWSWV
jgi:hypothetical protein